MHSTQNLNLIEDFREPQIIALLASKIKETAKHLTQPLRIMEVCGGHTHSIMKYGLDQLMPKNIGFIHGPGCPVCVIPKERIDHAMVLARMEDVILVTLGDMIKVPGSKGSLQEVRAQGHDVRFVYSPLDCLPIALEHPNKKVIFFAIGFETTTPMTAALVKRVIEEKVDNLLFHINHITVPEPMALLLDDEACQIDAFLGPSHVSVIAGAKIYEPFVKHYKKPLVVAGFEPVDVLEAVLMLINQVVEGRLELEIQYSRSVTKLGNIKAQDLIEKFFEKRPHFRWRGLGDIANSAWKLKDRYSYLDAEKLYEDLLPSKPIDDHKLCICGSILRGVAKPHDCAVFGTSCTPSTPLGSCMVSNEGACAAYYRFGGAV